MTPKPSDRRVGILADMCGSLGESAYSTARCRASMPDLRLCTSLLCFVALHCRAGEGKAGGGADFAACSDRKRWHPLGSAGVPPASWFAGETPALQFLAALRAGKRDSCPPPSLRGASRRGNPYGPRYAPGASRLELTAARVAELPARFWKRRNGRPQGSPLRIGQLHECRHHGARAVVVASLP
jgi:hypothetical protein